MKTAACTTTGRGGDGSAGWLKSEN